MPSSSRLDPTASQTADARPTFDSLGLAEPVLRAVLAEGYTTPTPIQALAIPHAMAGRDVLGCAQTGTGKTAAFSLPILHRLSLEHTPHPNQHQHRHLRALILSPTRELAVQIEDALRTYGRHTRLRGVCIFGGVGQNPQVRALRNGVDIAVATPGRLEDLMQQGHVDLSHVEVFVLDEADRMLDMGFIDPIRRVAGRLPKARQTLLFSATMPKAIRHLADALLTNPVNVQVAAVASTPDLVQQSVVLVARNDKPRLLVSLLTDTYVERAIVFSRTKHGADRIARHLNDHDITTEAIHGDKRQNVRQRALAGFRDGRVHVLVATDIAARGIDVDDVSHVINFDIPHEPETYVHRIGRTARAGASGKAISFCDPTSDERDFLRGIERLLKRRIDVVDSPNDAPKAAANARPLAHAQPEPRDDTPQAAHPQFKPVKGARRGQPRPEHGADQGPNPWRSDNRHPRPRRSAPSQFGPSQFGPGPSGQGQPDGGRKPRPHRGSQSQSDQPRFRDGPSGPRSAPHSPAGPRPPRPPHGGPHSGPRPGGPRPNGPSPDGSRPNGPHQRPAFENPPRPRQSSAPGQPSRKGSAHGASKPGPKHASPGKPSFGGSGHPFPRKPSRGNTGHQSRGVQKPGGPNRIKKR